MSTPTQIFFCAEFKDPKWSLPLDTPPEIRRGILGWQVEPAPVEGGVPENVARIIAAGLVRHVRVTFAEGIPRPFGSFSWSILHTADADQARQLFDAAYFSWATRSQLAFLSSLSTPPPEISKAHYRHALDREQFRTLATCGVTGILAPGVDGDVAGLYAWNDELWFKLTGSLKSTCEASGATWIDVQEGAFAEMLGR